jgi:ATP-binding cassette, subfamily C, bacterial
MSSSTFDGVHLAVAGPAQTRRAVVPLLRPDRGALAWTVFVDCLAAAAGLAAPWLLGKIINDAVCAEAVADARRAQKQTLSLRTVLYPSIDVSCVIPVVLVLVLGMVLIEDGLASLGAVVAVALYMLQLALAIGAILGWIDQTQSTGA